MDAPTKSVTYPTAWDESVYERLAALEHVNRIARHLALDLQRFAPGICQQQRESLQAALEKTP